MAYIPVPSGSSIYNFRAPCLSSSIPLSLPSSPHTISPRYLFFVSLHLSSPFPSILFVPRQTLTSWWQNGCQQLQASIPLAPEREVPPSQRFLQKPWARLDWHRPGHLPIPGRTSVVKGTHPAVPHAARITGVKLTPARARGGQGEGGWPPGNVLFL